jgi:hypothetical protein
LVLGIVALVFATHDLGAALGVIALGLGIWAVVRIRRSHGHLAGTGIAVAGIISACLCVGYFVAQVTVVYLLGQLFHSPFTVSETQFGHNQKLYLEAGYSPNVMGMDATGFADVASGTPAQLQVTGPASWTCQGYFWSHQLVSQGDFRNLPVFEVDNMETLQFIGPTGRYTFRLTIPSLNATVAHTFDAGPMTSDPQRWAAPAGCVSTATS